MVYDIYMQPKIGLTWSLIWTVLQLEENSQTYPKIVDSLEDQMN